MFLLLSIFRITLHCLEIMIFTAVLQASVILMPLMAATFLCLAKYWLVINFTGQRRTVKWYPEQVSEGGNCLNENNAVIVHGAVIVTVHKMLNNHHELMGVSVEEEYPDCTSEMVIAKCKNLLTVH